METFSKAEKIFLRGNQTSIARKLGCTKEYVNKVVNDKVTTDSELTRNIKKLARKIIKLYR